MGERMRVPVWTGCEGCERCTGTHWHSLALTGTTGTICHPTTLRVGTRRHVGQKLKSFRELPQPFLLAFLALLVLKPFPALPALTAPAESPAPQKLSSDSQPPVVNYRLLPSRAAYWSYIAAMFHPLSTPICLDARS